MEHDNPHPTELAPDELILLIAHRKYVDHVGTVELMKQAHDTSEQEAVCIVALLDVDDCTAKKETDRYHRTQSEELMRKRKMLQEHYPNQAHST